MAYVVEQASWIASYSVAGFPTDLSSEQRVLRAWIYLSIAIRQLLFTMACLNSSCI